MVTFCFLFLFYFIFSPHTFSLFFIFFIILFYFFLNKGRKTRTVFFLFFLYPVFLSPLFLSLSLVECPVWRGRVCPINWLLFFFLFLRFVTLARTSKYWTTEISTEFLECCRPLVNKLISKINKYMKTFIFFFLWNLFLSYPRLFSLELIFFFFKKSFFSASSSNMWNVYKLNVLS